MLIAELFGALLLLAALSAAYSGGWSEKSAAAVAGCSAIASLFAAWPGSSRWHHVELSLLLIDCAAFAGFATIMLKSDRFWPIFATSFQLCSVLSQLGPAFGQANNPFAFALDEQIWSWVILCQILWASQPVKSRGAQGRQ